MMEASLELLVWTCATNLQRMRSPVAYPAAHSALASCRSRRSGRTGWQMPCFPKGTKMLKTCTRCGSINDFPEDHPKRKGFWCKPCLSAAAVASAKKNRKTTRKNNNAYHSRISGKRASATALWRASHPEKRAAHQAVATSIRSGSLLKQPCEVCGSEIRIHAHHDDYSQPLCVRWLCHTHHMKHHQMLEARE